MAGRLNRFPYGLTLVSDTHRLASSVNFGTAAGGAHGAGENVMRKELHADDTLPSDKLSLGWVTAAGPDCLPRWLCA
jgi:hypothetical protein